MKVLQHIVLFKLKEVPPSDWEKLQKCFQNVSKVVPGIIGYSLSKQDASPYAGWASRSQGFTHMLVVTLCDGAALKGYIEHAAHVEFATMIRAFQEDVLVMDSTIDTYPEFALYGHTMMSKPGPAVAESGGFVGK